MARDYFNILGLTPGRHDSRDVARHFLRERARLLSALADPQRYAQTRAALDELHLAYATLRDPRRQEQYLRAWYGAERGAVEELRAFIAAALEGGLLRQSRREAIVAKARALGFSEFQAHLLIAQVQFGDEEIPLGPPLPSPFAAERRTPSWRSLAVSGVLAAALFVWLVWWVGA